MSAKEVAPRSAGRTADHTAAVDGASAPGQGYGGLQVYRRVMRDARPYWGHIGALFALSLLSSVVALLTPVPLAIAVDSVVGSQPLPGFLGAVVPAGVRESQTGVLLFAAGSLLLLTLLKQLQQFGELLLTTYTGEKLLLQFRSRLFGHFERLSLAYHDSRGSANSTYRVQYDAVAIQTIAVSGLIPFFTAIVTVGGMIYVTAKVDWQLALVSLAVVPALFILMMVYRKRLRAQWHDVKRLESAALSVVQESLQALRVVKAFGREEHARDRFTDRSSDSVRAKIGLAFVEGRFGILVGATIGLGMGAVLFVGTRHVLAGVITLGQLVLVMGYLQQLYDPMKTAAKKVGSLQSSLASAERVYSVLDEAPDFVDPPDALPVAQAAGTVAFRNVSFAYEGSHRVLDDVSFEVPAGTRLGIAGTTGAGKTTLVNLLTRFYDTSSGQILLDGVDLRRYKLADLRDQFAIVLQEPVLFSTSIGENIAYARPDADDADVVTAAKAAGAHEFISALPEGYGTRVGERGVRLSGGERQRIALARAFLKDAPILILDEPTSSVDARTEAQILEVMERLMHGRTAIVIAHRATTLEICDLRLELEQGRVVGVTRHGAAGMAPRVVPPVRSRRKRAPVPCDLVPHPVARAWRTLAPTGPRIERADLVRPVSSKAEIYRIALDDGLSIIAKRNNSDTALVERTIYESVLPRLPSPALRYFGYVGDEDEGLAWLFIEDAGDERCSLTLHGDIAAQWLGSLHGAAAALDVASSLPARDADLYLEHLRSARTRIVDSLDNPVLGADERGWLRALVLSCESIESDWSRVESICDTLPRTIVHGDFVDRNLRLKGDALVALDWGSSGWGVPALDVYEFAAKATRDDLSSYRSIIAEYMRVVGDDELQALLLLGKGFRLLASMDWASRDLIHARPEKGMSSLRMYEQPLRAWGTTISAAA